MLCLRGNGLVDSALWNFSVFPRVDGCSFLSDSQGEVVRGWVLGESWEPLGMWGTLKYLPPLDLPP